MEFSAKLNYKDKFFLVMAIPVYVPDGIGPVSVDSNNNNVNNIRRRRRNINNSNEQNLTVPINNGSTSHQAVSLPTTPVTLRSFTHHLITELYSLYTSNMMGNENQDGNEDSLTSAQDNQNGSNAMRSLNTLPDIIQCHSGISLDLTLDSRVRNTTSTNSFPNSTDNTMGQEECEDWTLELKVQVGSSGWRQTGLELRMIADRFQLENSRRQSATPRSLKCSLLISFPTAAMTCIGIGIASLVWLRRH